MMLFLTITFWCMQVGVRQVIAGWDLGIIGADDIPAMKVGHQPNFDRVGLTEAVECMLCICSCLPSS